MTVYKKGPYFVAYIGGLAVMGKIVHPVAYAISRDRLTAMQKCLARWRTAHA